MIDSAALLIDLKKQLKLLQVDLRERAEDPDDSWGQRLREQHSTALERGRTGHAWVTWRDGEVDQAAVAWLVATTFIRFCEDNDLLVGARDGNGRAIPVPWIAGPGVLLERALEHETAFFTQRPSANRRDWLQEAFKTLAAQPAGRALVDPRHSLVWSAEISAEAADGLIAFWRATDADGYLVHEFTDPDLDTRFLGDIYQDLSAYAKKTYALLQTPIFVEEFILEQTLSPAVEEFGLAGLKLIDPTCGSGHFLLGAFARLNRLWEATAPGLDVRERVHRAMDSIHGVDLNPFAVAIARFRLTVAGLRAAGITSLIEAPDFGYHLAVGDSLLGSHQAQLELSLGLEDDDGVFEYDVEDLSEYQGILKPGQYHVVVGNPPYITVRDPQLKRAYKAAYPVCHGLWTLVVPFMDLFFRLAIRGSATDGAGYVGKITGNSFMRREFGKKVIENLLSGRDHSNPVDLICVIDSSGAWLPGHNFDGTPTVILVGRRRYAVAQTVRTVIGKKDEAGKPPDPSRGPVWTEIVSHLDEVGYQGEFVDVNDLSREVFGSHPWSLGEALAADIVEAMSGAGAPLAARAERIGFMAMSHADEQFTRPLSMVGVGRLPERHFPLLVSGHGVREFVYRSSDCTWFPTGGDSDATVASEELWPWRHDLEVRAGFSGGTYKSEGRDWYSWHQVPRDEGASELTLVYPEVATHNHFVLDRGAAVFKQTAPIIKLSKRASEEDHWGLLGVLNSSCALFWLKQVAQKKGGDADISWLRTYQFNGTKVGTIPVPGTLPTDRGRNLDSLAGAMRRTTPEPGGIKRLAERASGLREALRVAEEDWRAVRGRLIYEQEELDWESYRLYGLIDEDLTYGGAWSNESRGLSLGERAFEVVMARKVVAGEEAPTWFERHGSMPIVQLPTEWPEDYRALVARRMALIEDNHVIGLLERPEFKRRWESEGWERLTEAALVDEILGRLERPELWFDANHQPLTRSVAELAHEVRGDEFLVQCAQVLAASEDLDLTGVLMDLLKQEPVPYLAALRLKPAGIEKYRAWQEVWALQRLEDEGHQAVLPMPPRYDEKDFAKSEYWRSRGKLDVPKERFISYPGVVRTGDSTPVLGWAGWDRAQQAQALARELGTQQGLGADRDQLLPLVAGLVELEPWLDQWHGEIDPRYGQSPANLIHQTVESYAGQLGVTRDDLNAWRPPAPTRGRRRATA